MIEEISTYFKAEKTESLLFIIVGFIAIGIAIYFFIISKQGFYKGMAIPLVAIGIIQIIVGSTVYFRTDDQITDLTILYKQNPVEFANQELPRMSTVNKNFDTYKYIEALFIIAGVALLLFMKGKQFWLGLGVGLIIQGSLMITLDIFAERRADRYTELIMEVGK